MIFDGISEAWENMTGNLAEKLNRTFYSDREAFQDKHKNSSQIAKEVDLETPYIAYDPFAMYTNSFALGASNAQAVTHNELVRRWREASMLPEVDEAITEISSESIVFDELEDAISIKLDDVELTENIKSKIQESFDKILFLLDFNEKGEELFRQWYVDSVLNFEIVYNNRKPKDGIQKLILLPPFDIQKYKNEKDGTVRWYINKQQTFNAVKDLENAEITYFDEQITQITSGNLSPDKKMFFSPLQKCMKAINQLYLLEDSLIIYRLTRSNEKRVFKIDTGNLTKTKAEEYMKGLMLKYRQKKVYNTESGTLENANKSISVLEDFWFPYSSSTGKGSSVDTLQGSTTNFGGFDDIDYFINKVYNALGVPSNRRSKENRVTINSNIDIEKDEMKFFKYIQKLRRRFNNLFVDLLKKDLIAKQVMSLDDWIKIQEKIKFIYATSNEISTIKKVQIEDMKINSANNAIGLIEGRILSSKYIQKQILGLSDEEIQEIDADNMASGGQVDALGNAPMAGGGAPEGGGETPPGFEEVPAGGAQPAAQPEPESESESESAPTGGSRFQQKAREAGLSKDIIENLREGDIITDGKTRLIFEGGKLKKL